MKILIIILQLLDHQYIFHNQDYLQNLIIHRILCSLILQFTILYF